MQFNILYKPAHTLAECHLQPNETVRAESGVMVSMTRNVSVQAAAKNPADGGMGKRLLKGLKRAALGGESFFTNTYTAQNQPGHVTFAPSLCGDMVVHDCQGEQLIIQGSSYVAAPDSVTIDTSRPRMEPTMAKIAGHWMLDTTSGSETMTISLLDCEPPRFVAVTMEDVVWAPGASTPKGGRRKTSSVAPKSSRYVRLALPFGNCSTVGSADRSISSGMCRRR